METILSNPKFLHQSLYSEYTLNALWKGERSTVPKLSQSPSLAPATSPFPIFPSQPLLKKILQADGLDAVRPPLLASELVQATGLRPPPRLWCVPMPAPLRLLPGTPASRSQPAQPDHGARLRSASPSSPTTEVAVCLDRATAPCPRASLARPTLAAGESASRGMEMRPRRRREKQGPLAEEPARLDT
jgi:hypothetical protein